VEEIAKWSADNLPVFFAGRPFLGPLNAARNACCEIGRVFTQFYDFPEMNHVLIEALAHPDVAKKNKYIFFESNFDNERIKKRFEITKKLMEEQGLTHMSYTLKGSTFLVQCLELAHFGAWLGFHYSMIRGEDPGPEPWIIKLKESLSQPIH
jgi:glucose/mannose-6-phosphate isomerase